MFEEVALCVQLWEERVSERERETELEKEEGRHLIKAVSVDESFFASISVPFLVHHTHPIQSSKGPPKGQSSPRSDHQNRSQLLRLHCQQPRQPLCQMRRLAQSQARLRGHTRQGRRLMELSHQWLLSARTKRLLPCHGAFSTHAG